MLKHNSRIHLMQWFGSLGQNNYRSVKQKGQESKKTNIYLLWGIFTKTNTSQKQVVVLSAQFKVGGRDQISRGLMLSTVRLLRNSAAGV